MRSPDVLVSCETDRLGVKPDKHGRFILLRYVRWRNGGKSVVIGIGNRKANAPSSDAYYSSSKKIKHYVALPIGALPILLKFLPKFASEAIQKHKEMLKERELENETDKLD